MNGGMPVIEHGGPGCTCTYAGEDPHCPHHGYEAVIRRQEAEVERLREALRTCAAMTEDQGVVGCARKALNA